MSLGCCPLNNYFCFESISFFLNIYSLLYDEVERFHDAAKRTRNKRRNLLIGFFSQQEISLYQKGKAERKEREKKLFSLNVSLQAKRQCRWNAGNESESESE